ncbi:glycosyltransferase family A protein [Bacillus cereus]|uniref:glycosyltransferase family A protein n=1 Tax=Bacillus cereus TaxID=1396 RepID=UPI00211D3FD3|nr:glycosyltransferase family 2 protein [Bacillus cereus]MDA1968374.1 glycosyltransferase family 2 protein [Bacillus cereus]
MNQNKMINVIVPTLGTRVEEIKRLLNSLENQSYKNINVIIISQDNHNVIENILRGYKLELKHIKLEKKGLSYARNQGLEFVKSGIITFSDDDCWYPENAFEKVIKKFKNNDVSALSFQIYDPEVQKFYKEYPMDSIKVLNFREVLKISSIEFFINLNEFDREDLIFDERFGLGTNYPSGEENILLVDLLKKKYKISYINEIIVFHKKKDQGSNVINSRTFIGKGPLFKRMKGTVPGIGMLTIFLIKKFNSIERPIYSFGKSLSELITFKR